MPSTVVEHIDYDAAMLQLKITFLSGAIYVYYDVPQIVFDRFEKYKSKGTFLNRVIKNKFRYERLE